VAISTSRGWCLLLVLASVGLSWPGRLSLGKQLPQNESSTGGKSSSLRALDPSEPSLSGRAVLNYHQGNNGRLPDATNFGLREEIPEKYKRRYEEWKRDFLSTETGHRQWVTYAGSSGFLLTITIARENGYGAETGKYKWDASGRLVAATIELGNSLDHGYPNAVYYPVQNSLEPFESSYVIDGDILAATKLAHEFGHVIRMNATDGELYRLQTQLVPVYNSIFLRNGHDTTDPRLVSLALKMGGTPMEIWEDREYWGEVNAMLFLRDRISKESFRCRLFRRIERSVRLYARNYEDRFIQVAQTTSPAEPCGW
jgi:hypothetical protein